MRIAFWVRSGNKYGSLERYIALFAERCKEQGHDFLLMNEVQNTAKEYCARLANADASQVVVGESLKSPLQVFGNAVHNLRRWEPDIVQLHFVNSLALPLLRISGVPLVYQTYHSGINHSISSRTRFFRKLDNIFATRVFAVSERVRIDEIRAGVNPSHIEKLYLGLRLSDFEGKHLVLEGPEPIGWDDGHVRKIVTVSRFFPVKGIRLVVEAAVQVMRDSRDIVWWFVGREGPESKVCNQIIDNAGLRQRIMVLGQRNDVPALLHQSNIQVIGSLSEGFGLMALEAAACGVPTVGTRIAGLDEAILDGETGILVEAGSSQALAQATRWLLDHSAECKRMGKVARRHVKLNFDSEKQITRLLNIYENDAGGGLKIGN